VRRLAQAGGALVAVPTALPVGTYGEFIARRMIPVRAFENQVFVAYVNHCGADSLFTYAGLTTIAAPDGSVLAGAEAQGEALLFAEVEPAGYAQSAAQNTYLRDLRTV
jgi:predicted amidohydrolase